MSDADARPLLVVATRNPGKVAEFARLLSGFPWQLCNLDEVGVTEELAETADTYAGNAISKASRASELCGHPTIADDSGIEVLALRGWPGPLSARWMGDGATDADRLRGLLEEVAKCSPDDRRVRYVAAVALAMPGAEPVLAQDSCDGVLVEPRGGAGFGYDPAFLSDDLGITFGQATEPQKDAVSHRGRALRKLTESHLLTWSAGYR